MTMLSCLSVTFQKMIALVVQLACGYAMSLVYDRFVHPYNIFYGDMRFDFAFAVENPHSFLQNTIQSLTMIVKDPNLTYKFAIVYALILSQYIVISEAIDYVASTVYESIPYLNTERRPQKNRIGRAKGYTIYALRWIIPVFCGYIFWFHPMFIHYEQRDLSLRYYTWLGCHVQLSLIFADLFYGAWHHLQHKWKSIYYLTGHDYHHQFHFPYAREGTWLGFIDLWVSASLIGFVNIFASSLIMGKLTVLELFLELGLVHEMNGCDHCGKVLPFHSGVPFFPFLSKLLGFDKSVQAHEAHHNLGRLSYGLLGLYDRIAGTSHYAKV